MALMVTHPDYMHFGGFKCPYSEYPADLYSEFLEHIRSAYQGQYWHALPRDVARFWTDLVRKNGDVLYAEPVHLQNKYPVTQCNMQMEMQKQCELKILMLVENAYPSDSRVRKEAMSLTAAGHKVIVLALRANKERFHEIINGVEVYRLPEMALFEKVNTGNDNTAVKQRISKIKSTLGYFFEYLYFTSACFLLSIFFLLKHKVDVVHANNPPDTLFLIGLLFKLFGKKYVFDHHDLSPDLYAFRFDEKRNIIYRILLLLERASCKISDVIISTNQSYKDIVINRHEVNPNKIHIVRNNPIINDCCITNIKSISDSRSKFYLVYIGSINPQDGVDTLIDILHYLVHELNRKDFICNILGDGDALKDVQNRARALGMDSFVHFKGFVHNRDVVKTYLSTADVGLEPAPDSFVNRHSTFIKVMEYMAAGIPMVAFDLTETRVSTDSCAVLVQPGNVKSFAHAINRLLEQERLRRELGEASQKRVFEQLTWESAETNLVAAYRSLTCS
jgi:glycosyltransferase involved in cell wall biosynthesis